MAVSESDVVTALAKVQDPELKRDLAAVGNIKDVRVTGGTVRLTVELTTPASPLEKELRANIERALRAVKGVAQVELEVGWLIRTTNSGQVQGQELIPKVKNVVLVGAGKGGVGKSTVSVNLAVALQQFGARVGLLDADFYGPSVPMMTGVSGRPNST